MDDVAKVVTAFPDVLLLDTPTQIAPVVRFLRDEICLDDDDIPKVLQAFPAMLSAGVEQMRKRAIFLTSLDINPDNLSKIVRAFPSILFLDVSTQMIPVIQFLVEIGVVNLGRFVT